jgi:ketose-bisphosphate aldolase
MSIVSFRELMAEAKSHQYAVGYFEAWNLESVLAVADAASAMRSPVMLGFSGIYVPNSEPEGSKRLRPYAALGLEVCRQLSIPACLVFNESPHLDWVKEAIQLEFGLVMFSDPEIDFEDQPEHIRRVVEEAHPKSVAVEAELKALPGVMHGLSAVPEDLHLTDPDQARAFVEFTGVDSLAVNVGQVHVHGRKEVGLDLPRLAALQRALSVPLALHGGTSISPAYVVEAIKLGILKINVGSGLKRSYFEGLRSACAKIDTDYNPYEVVGSGLPIDVLAAGRVALMKTVEHFMSIYGSAGKA